MSVVHPETLRPGEYGRAFRTSEPDNARLRTKRESGRFHVRQRWIWIMSVMLLATFGWIIFNFLMALVTLD